MKLSSFYVSEFPDSSSVKDLFDLLGCIGKVVEVSISQRRNNIGKRFGFASFVEVEVDGGMFDVRLDNILIGGKKIHVNLPRYKIRKSFKKGGLGQRGKKVINTVSDFRRREEVIRDSRSFVEVLADGVRKAGGEKAEDLKLRFKSKDDIRLS